MALDPRIVRFLRTRPAALVALPASATYWNLRLAAARARGRKVLVHYVDGTGYLPFAAPIWERLGRRREAARINLYLAARPGERRKVAEAAAGGALPIRGVIPAWTCAALLSYDLFLTTHQSSAVPLVRRGLRLCTFHGLPAKGGTFVPEEWRNLDGAFLHGPLQQRLFEEYAAGRATAELWGRPIGFPKSDALVRGELHRSEILASLGLDPERSTVLYAPSWEAGTSLRESGRQVVEQLLDVDVQVLLKLHPMSTYPAAEARATGGVDWIAVFRDLEADPRFRHVRGGDVAALVAASDLLVTDVSSVAFEAFLIDRPVIFLEVPRFFDETVAEMYGLTGEQARGDLRYNCGRAGGRIVADPTALGAAVLEELADPGARRSARETVRRELVFHPGEGAEHAAAAILDLLGLTAADGGSAAG